jgi:hypothetical protein
MAKEEANALVIFERNIVRVIYGPVKEAETCLIIKREDEGHMKRGRYCR